MAVLICATLVLIPSCILPSMEQDAVIFEEPSVTLAYTSHPTINITSNSDFETQSWPGDGTPTTPYVISNLNITSEDIICILIVNTTSYFEIRDCWFSSQGSDWGSGIITLQNVTHARVEDNEFGAGHIAISVEDASGCRFARNIIGTSLMGFLGYNLNNSEFIANTQSSESMGYPVHIQDSNFVNIRANYFRDSLYEGIGLTSCENCIIEDNILSGTEMHNGQYGVAMRDSRLCSVNNNNVTDFGTAIEITDGSMYTVSENFIERCWGGIAVKGNDTSVIDNEISVTGFCVQLRGSFDSVVHSNELFSTIVSLGIDISGGGHCNVTQNILTRHEFGIRIQGATNILVSNNDFSNCLSAVSLEESAYIGLEDGPPIDCKIINNNLEDCGIRFSITDPSDMDHQISGNLVNGRPLAYFYEESNMHLDGRNYGRIHLIACEGISLQGGVLDELSIMFSSNCEILGVSIANKTNGIYVRYSNRIDIGYSELVGNEVGIRVEWSNYSHIVNNVAQDNRYGIYLDSSPNSTIYNCDAFENEIGMVLIGAHHSHIESNQINRNVQGIYVLRTIESYFGYNDVLENRETGLLLNRGARFNRIIANSFGWNSVNAVCSGYDNVWDDGVETGNSWSDLGGAQIYIIDEDDFDNFPSLLENAYTTTISSNTSTTSNRTSPSGVVTPEIFTITGFVILGFLAVAILFDKRKGSIK